MTGIAILMIASQLGKITGAPVSGDEFVGLVRSFAAQYRPMPLADDGRWRHRSLLLLLGFGRWAPSVPGPLIAVLAATVVVAVLSLQTKGIEVVGTIPGRVARDGSAARGAQRCRGADPAGQSESRLSPSPTTC